MNASIRHCKKCFQPLISTETSTEQWPITTLDSRGDNFEYLCFPCGLGYDEEDFQTPVYEISYF